MSETDNGASEPKLPARGTRYFQICEDDVAELERVLPEVYDACMMQIANNPRLRVQCRRVKEIMSNVRWNYGPHMECSVIPGDGP